MYLGKVRKWTYMSRDGTGSENTWEDGNLHQRIVIGTEEAYNNKKEKTQNNKSKH